MQDSSKKSNSFSIAIATSLIAFLVVGAFRYSPSFRSLVLSGADVAVPQPESDEQSLAQGPSETDDQSERDPLLVRASGALQTASGVRVGAVRTIPWSDDRLIPAKLELDPARHYAVTAPADVIVEELICPLGKKVHRGEPLLEMSSSQLTTLRGGLMRQQLLTQKAQRSVDWHREIEKRVKEIIEKIEATSDNPSRDWLPPPSVQTADYGAKILSAYAKYWAAMQFSQISERAVNSGVMAEKAVIERTTDRETAKAMLRGAIEQSRFDVEQAILAAESDLAAAEGALQSIQADMRRYLGLKKWDDAVAAKPIDSLLPDRFVHYSPGDGIVLERYFANGERAATGELVVLVADIDSLWCVGDLRQGDWDLLQLHEGDEVSAEIVGLESLGRVAAKIEMVGGTVQSNSGSIRLTASIANQERRFRPGMIARLILNRPTKAMVVPLNAIFSNDGVDYLVKQESKDEFRLVPIKVGRRSNDMAEINEGASDGWNILVSGVFPIASQAFLEKE
jgi:multidrug efflux pump subunit AcrA (membrane-fusion protein)